MHITTLRKNIQMCENKYYIAVVNNEIHKHEWNALKLNLKISGANWIVYHNNTISCIELNEVTKEVYKQMAYCLN